MKKSTSKQKPVPTITGKELAGLLVCIHTHADSLLKNSLPKDADEYLKVDSSEIYYREEDLLKVLKAIGLPEPEWEITLSISQFKKLRKQKK